METSKATLAEIVDAVVRSVQSNQPGRRSRSGSGYDFADKVGLTEELAMAAFRNPDAPDGYRYSLNSVRMREGRIRIGNSYDVESLLVEPLRIDALLRYFATRPEVSKETKALMLEFVKHFKAAVQFSQAYVRAMTTDEDDRKPTNGRAKESPKRKSA